MAGLYCSGTIFSFVTAMDPYVLYITFIGAAALGMAWMPSITRYTHISYSVIYLVIGMALYTLLPLQPLPLPNEHKGLTLHLTELVVIVSLMGTGLKIDQPFSFKTWTIPFRLITITMLLSIAAMAFIAYYFL